VLATAKRYTRFILLAIGSLAFLAFAVDNRETAHVSFFPLPYMADMPLFLFAIVCFFFGALGGYVCSATKSRTLTGLLKNEKKRADSLQNQLDSEYAERVTAVSAKISSL